MRDRAMQNLVKHRQGDARHTAHIHSNMKRHRRRLGQSPTAQQLTHSWAIRGVVSREILRVLKEGVEQNMTSR